MHSPPQRQFKTGLPSKPDKSPAFSRFDADSLALMGGDAAQAFEMSG
jgi:hypothetical protein